MKKIVLHGSLGKAFKNEWEIDVDSPAEAISALFANNPGIERYLIQKEQEGIQYGIKKGKASKFIKKEDFELKTREAIHVFPIPKGSAFVGGLVTLFATTYASQWVNNKIAEALERDENTVRAQTNSYLYNGKDNRYEQGAVVPLGYGRLRVGSNTISSCVANYDYNSEKGKILNFNSGLYSLVPDYSPNYIDFLGPLGSAFLLNGLDGSSQFRAVDPTTKFLQNNVPSASIFGAGGMYTRFQKIEDWRKGPPGGPPIVETNAIMGGVLGYLKYYYIRNNGVEQAKLLNYVDGDSENHGEGGGNWGSIRKLPFEQENKFPMETSQQEVLSTPLVCVQSMPQLEISKDDKRFFPITFATEKDGLDYLPQMTRDAVTGDLFPIQIGQRWREGGKENGLGWFKLESAAVYKSIDLIGEGPIGGFSNSDGEGLNFSRTAETPTAEGDNRYAKDDYLQAVYLNDLPVKEIINKDGENWQNAYNINEFDIDVGLNKDGEIGSNNQDVLEKQYSFTALTKEINKPLFGPRNEYPDSRLEEPVEDFKFNTIYNLGQNILFNGNSFKIKKDITKRLEKGSEFISGEIYNKPKGGDNDLVDFYEAQGGFNEFKTFDFKSGDYTEGQKLTISDATGGFEYYAGTEHINKYKGVYGMQLNYTVGEFVSNSTSSLYQITGGSVGQPIDNRAEQRFGIAVESKEGVLSTTPKSALAIFEDYELTKDIEEEVVDTANSAYWEKRIIQPAGVERQGGAYNAAIKSLAQPTRQQSNEIFQFFDLERFKKNQAMLKGGEEYYLSHSVINPLVREVYIALQVNELMYIYEGDEIKTTYKVGAMLGFILGALGGAQAAGGAFRAASAKLKTIQALQSAGVLERLAPGMSKNLTADATAQKSDALRKLAFGAALGAGLGGFIGEMLEFSIGTKHENSGETWPNRARFRIKYGNEGEVMYSTDVYLYGVATSNYQKDIKIYFPPNPQNKKRIIKVYKLNRELNPVAEGELALRYKEKMSLGSITEITPVTLNYPNSVVIGTRVNARDVPSIPTRSYDLKLKKVAIPSTYNPNTKRYNSETWNGLFIGQSSKEDRVADSSKQWTDNPAWCLYDLISDTRYGTGRFGIKPENIDRWTLYRIAKYCDEEVPTGYSAKFQRREFEVSGQKTIKIKYNSDVDKEIQFKEEFNYIGKKIALFYKNKQESITIVKVDSGSQEIILEIDPIQESGECAVSIDYPLVEARYTLNAMLLSPQNAFKLITEFAQIFRAYAYWAGGTINFFQDEKKDAVMLFANNNISQEGFTYSSTPKTSRTNSCKIQYIDKYNDFISKMEYSEDSKSIRENNIIEQKIDGFGVTSPGQAKRAVDFLIKTANLETELVSFTTSAIGSYLKPGDIINVVDSKRTVGRFAGKVLNIDISGDGKMAELDVDFPIRAIIEENDKSTWKDINLYSISGNQTIESLEAMGAAGDSDIQNIRTSQIGTYTASKLSNNDTRIKILNIPYSFVSGQFTWIEALRDAQARGGGLATINNATDQSQVESVVPSESMAWIGGYYQELPAPEKFVWQQPQACTSDEITYFNWGKGFPDVGEPLETDLSSGVVTDVDEWYISSDPSGDGGNFIAVSGSEEAENNGDWVTLSGTNPLGYILENKANNSLLSLGGIAGTTFSINDSVNFSGPKTYRVININEQTVGTFSVQGVEYDKDKFDNIERNASLKEPSSPVIFTEKNLDPPADLTISVNNETQIGRNQYVLIANWSTVVGASRYRVQFFNGTQLLSTFEMVNNNAQELQVARYKGPDIIDGQSYYARVYPLAN